MAAQHLDAEMALEKADGNLQLLGAGGSEP
jgi:hypothetical protein